MSINRIDHLYVATSEFGTALKFWRELGFTISTTWGEQGHRAAQLEAGSAKVVLAEDEPAGVTVHFGTDDLAEASESIGATVTIETPAEETHWGTSWMRVRDPEGAVYSIEETG